MSQAVCKKMRDALLANTILHHFNFLDAGVQTVSLCPRCHTAIFESIAPTDDSLEVGDFLSCFSCFFLLRVQSRERICNQDSGVWPKSVVIEDEMLEGHMRGEESHEGSLGVETESVVIEVYRVEFR